MRQRRGVDARGLPREALWREEGLGAAPQEGHVAEEADEQPGARARAALAQRRGFPKFDPPPTPMLFLKHYCYEKLNLDQHIFVFDKFCTSGGRFDAEK